MGMFENRNREASEGENPEVNSGNSGIEKNDISEGDKAKLDSSEKDRNKEFRDSMKVSDSPSDNSGKEKLDTSNSESEGDSERGNFERSYDGGRTDINR